LERVLAGLFSFEGPIVQQPLLGVLALSGECFCWRISPLVAAVRDDDDVPLPVPDPTNIAGAEIQMRHPIRLGLENLWLLRIWHEKLPPDPLLA
jgi:hypothetical protein